MGNLNFLRMNEKFNNDLIPINSFEFINKFIKNGNTLVYQLRVKGFYVIQVRNSIYLQIIRFKYFGRVLS